MLQMLSILLYKKFCVVFYCSSVKVENLNLQILSYQPQDSTTTRPQRFYSEDLLEPFFLKKVLSKESKITMEDRRDQNLT